MERFTATKKKFAWSVKGFLHLSSALGLVVPALTAHINGKTAMEKRSGLLHSDGLLLITVTVQRARVWISLWTVHHSFFCKDFINGNKMLTALWGHLHWRMVYCIFEGANAKSLLTNTCYVLYPFAMYAIAQHLLIHLF